VLEKYFRNGIIVIMNQNFLTCCNMETITRTQRQGHGRLIETDGAQNNDYLKLISFFNMKIFVSEWLITGFQLTWKPGKLMQICF